MGVAPDALPDDVETLRAMLLAERAKPTTAEEIDAQLQAYLEGEQCPRGQVYSAGGDRRNRDSRPNYEHIIAQLRRLTFAKRSERIDNDQLQPALEDLQQGLAEIEGEEEKADAELKAHRTRQRAIGGLRCRTSAPVEVDANATSDVRYRTRGRLHQQALPTRSVGQTG